MRSVAKAFEHLGFGAEVTQDPKTLLAAQGVILPGVGSSGSAMAALESLDLVEPLKEVASNGTPFFGVCLGLQLLMDGSDEDPRPCLGIVPGWVRRIPPPLKVPHMGWNQVELNGEEAVFQGVESGSNFYFVHSYYADPEDESLVKGLTEYGLPFCSVLARRNLVASQFHPGEKRSNRPQGVRQLRASHGDGRVPGLVEVIPAIDLRGGQVVRLYQGDFSRETVYSDDPVAVAVEWQNAGVARLHVVDLEGARDGRLVNMQAIEAVLGAVRVPVQVGGGIRSMETAKGLLEMGATRVVFGTAAVRDPDLIEAACAKLGSESVVVGVDARNGKVAVQGWQHTETNEAVDLMKSMVSLGVNRFIYTDIEVDGTLAGPNVDSVAALMKEVAAPIISSGGVSSIKDLSALSKTGVEGVIIGQALYQGKIDLRKAVSLFQGAG